MNFFLHPKFEKQFLKLSASVKQSFKERSLIFEQDIHNPVLNLHSLKGDKLGLFSINITGDYRATFRIRENVAVFYEIGRHRELYNK